MYIFNLNKKKIFLLKLYSYIFLIKKHISIFKITIKALKIKSISNIIYIKYTTPIINKSVPKLGITYNHLCIILIILLNINKSTLFSKSFLKNTLTYI
jgi:hypothetical protein